MNPEAARALCCPVCGGALACAASALRCPAGHSFDVAREGYVHLLPVQKKRAKAPGDSPEMVAARRRFLQAGHYAPFAQALGRLVCGLAVPGAPLRVVDAGCGEGYYDEAVCRALAAQGTPCRLAGFDISKAAVRLAAKRLPQAAYAVAGSFHAPVRTGWADVLLDVFSPFAQAEFARMVRGGGHLIYAVPGPRHLYGLKQVLYAQPYENPVQQVDDPGFEQVDERRVQAQVTVRGQQLADLFAMTPYYWRTPREGAQALAALPGLTTPIEFRFLVFRRAG